MWQDSLDASSFCIKDARTPDAIEIWSLGEEWRLKTGMEFNAKG